VEKGFRVFSGNKEIGDFKISRLDKKSLQIECGDKDPDSISYCWKNNALPTIFNSKGMPAAGFTSKILD